MAEYLFLLVLLSCWSSHPWKRKRNTNWGHGFHSPIHLILPVHLKLVFLWSRSPSRILPTLYRKQQIIGNRYSADWCDDNCDVHIYIIYTILQYINCSIWNNIINIDHLNISLNSIVSSRLFIYSWHSWLILIVLAKT